MTDGTSVRPSLHMRMDRAQSAIRLTCTNITDQDWATIAISVTDSLPRDGQPLHATAEQVVSRAQSLRGKLKSLGATLDADSEVQALLRRLLSDQGAVDDLVRGQRPHRPVRAPTAGTHRMTRALKDFQVAQSDRLWEMRHGANFSVPGAGKTTVTLALHLRERAEGRAERLLVVGPLSAFESWEEESNAIIDPPLSTTRWTGPMERDADVVIVNYQRLRSALPDLVAWMSGRKVHLVIDEAHRAKRGTLGEWGRALTALAPLAARRDILTGTPAPNHPKDLVALLDLLWPGGMATRSLPQTAMATEPTSASMTAMGRAISPLYVRATKQDLRLPPVMYVSVPVRMGDLQQAIYDAMLRRYAGLLDLGAVDADMFGRMGEVTMYLIQAASSPQLLSAATDPSRTYRYPPLAIPPGSALARMIETFADHEVPSKIAEACKIVFRNANETPSRKTLIWSNFPANLLMLENQLAALQPALIYGGVPSIEDADPEVRTRESELRRFRTDDNCKVLLANPAAMAEGVSVHHDCHDAIYIDRTFNAGQYLQSLDRIHRLGLPEGTETRFFLLTSEGSIDDRIEQRLKAKVTRLGQMLDDRGLVRMALPDDENTGEWLDDDLDIAEVLQHLGGAR